jgi:Tol biopolymer transport system component
MPAARIFRRSATAALTFSSIFLIGGAIGGSARSSAAQTPSAAPQGVTRRVWADTGLFLEWSSPSPDGRFVTTADLGFGNLGVRDLATGRTWQLTNESAKSLTGFAFQSVFSPDGKQIAYTWFDYTAKRYQVRSIGLDSTPPRVVFSGDTTLLWMEVMDWTADGAYIVATVQQRDKSSQLLFIPTSGAPARLIRTFADWRGPSAIRVSPNGRHIAYSFPPRKDDGRRDIYLLSVQDNRETVIARHAVDDAVLGWTAGGDQIVFTSSRAGSPAVWSIAVEGGRAVSEPRLVRADLWRSQPLRLTSSGKLFYIVEAGDADLLMAPFDAMTGNLQGTPVSVTRSPGRPVRSPVWSGNGRFLAYLTSSGDGDRVGATQLTIRSLENGESRELNPKVGYLSRISWFADGRSILLMGADDKGTPTALKLDLRTGEARPLTESTLYAVPSLDGKAIYFVNGGERQFGSELAARDLSSGKQRSIFVAPDSHYVSAAGGRYEPNLLVTRDGKSIVFVVGRTGVGHSTLMIAPVAGGPARTIASSPSEWAFTNVRLVGLTPDGNELLFTTRRNMTAGLPLEAASLWRVPLAGGAFVQLEKPWSRLASATAGECSCSMAVSPDGRRVAFTAGRGTQELWMMEDAALRSVASRSRTSRR